MKNNFGIDFAGGGKYVPILFGCRFRAMMFRTFPVQLTVLVCVFSVTCLAQENAVVLSERVGSIIDAQECEYFGLFPSVHSSDDSGYRMPVWLEKNPWNSKSYLVCNNYTGQGVASFELSTDEFFLLRNYINYYDTLRFNTTFNSDDFEFPVKYDVLVEREIIDEHCFPEYGKGEIALVYLTLIKDTGKADLGYLLYVDTARVLVANEQTIESVSHPVEVQLANIHSARIKDKGFLNTGSQIAIIGGIGIVTALACVAATIAVNSFMPFVEAPADSDPDTDGSVDGGVLAAIGGVAGIIGAGVGLIQVQKIRTRMDDYYSTNHADLLQLRERSYYNHGLPPELRH